MLGYAQLAIVLIEASLLSYTGLAILLFGDSFLALLNGASSLNSGVKTCDLHGCCRVGLHLHSGRLSDAFILSDLQ